MRLIIFLALLLICGLTAGQVSGYQLKTQHLKRKPAIVIAAFGTSTRAQVTFDHFNEQLKKALPDYEIRWAFTSEIIREKMNQSYARKGISRYLMSLQEALARLEAEGYRRVVVQPLHIFPGYEYRDVLEICERFPGLRIVVGEPLLYRWEYLHEVLEALEKEFLPPEEGFNVLVAHGTPTAADPANIVYMGLQWILEEKYSNVALGTVEGIPDAESVLARAKKYPASRVRFIPFMYVAGDHIMNDIMGEDLEDGELSWRQIVETAGKKANCVRINYQGKSYYRGLGFYDEVNQVLIKNLKRALKIIEVY